MAPIVIPSGMRGFQSVMYCALSLCGCQRLEVCSVVTLTTPNGDVTWFWSTNIHHCRKKLEVRPLEVSKNTSTYILTLLTPPPQTFLRVNQSVFVADATCGTQSPAL